MTTPLSLRAHGLGTQTHAEASKIQEDGCDGRGDDIAMVKLMDFDEEVGVLGWRQDKACTAGELACDSSYLFARREWSNEQISAAHKTHANERGGILRHV